MRLRTLSLFLIPGLLAAQSLQDFEKKVTKFTLPNGLTFLIIERHEAPVVSFHTYVNVGSVDDPSGRERELRRGDELRLAAKPLTKSGFEGGLGC